MSVRGLFRLMTVAGLAALGPAPALADPHTAEPVSVVEPAPAPTAPTAAAKPLAPPKPAITLRANADLTRQTLTVIANGKTVGTWAISSGVEDHATPRGVFQPEWTSKLWFSKTYDNAPMPNAVFFKDGAAIHATQSTGALGRAASHGCVRLAPQNAETFYKLVQHHGLAHTRISVTGTPHYPAPMVARRDSQPDRRYAGSYYPHGYGSRSSWSHNNSPFASNSGTGLPISAARIR